MIDFDLLRDTFVYFIPPVFDITFLEFALDTFKIGFCYLEIGPLSVSLCYFDIVRTLCNLPLLLFDVNRLFRISSELRYCFYYLEHFRNFCWLICFVSEFIVLLFDLFCLYFGNINYSEFYLVFYFVDILLSIVFLLRSNFIIFFFFTILGGNWYSVNKLVTEKSTYTFFTSISDISLIEIIFYRPFSILYNSIEFL